MRSIRRHLDPAKSRFAFKFQRWWLTPVPRALIRTGIPCGVILLGAWAAMTQPETQRAMALSFLDAKAAVEERPEFMVHALSITGASNPVSADLRVALGVDFPVSSFDLELDQLRATAAEHPAVEAALVRLRPGGVLELTVAERQPALVWREAEGLALLSLDGTKLRAIARRADYPNLPLVAGKGAYDAVDEALALIQAAEPVNHRLRGLIRVGERRWDLVLDRDQRVMLPEQGALAALQKTLLIDTAQELFARDVSHIDLRNPNRPTIRLGGQAQALLTQTSGTEQE
ncbi:MAG: cell division protein FtsQ/DivIB [Shimia sp.]